VPDPEKPSEGKRISVNEPDPKGPQKIDLRPGNAAEGETPEPAGAPDPAPAGPPSTRYRIVGSLGEGGMAVVHEAADDQLSRTVAIKCLRQELAEKQEYRERFFDEAKIMAALDHPGAIPVYEAGRLPSGEDFYSMKKVCGVTLLDLLVARAPGEVESRHAMLHFLDIFERICQTMAAAHAEGIIHRDLKPENVMVDQFGAVYVVDWGLAKFLPGEGDPSDSGRTRLGVVMGTPAYMSPEQASGFSSVADCQTDVFSLGVILYEILTGAGPFRGQSEAEAMKGVLYHDPDPPRKRNRRVGRALSAICMKALNKDPYRRYQTARELADDLRHYLEFRSISAVRPSLTERVANWARRRPVLATFLGTLLFVVLFLGVVFGIDKSKEKILQNGIFEVIETERVFVAELEEEMESIGKRLSSSSLAAAERDPLEDRLRMLEAQRDFKRRRIANFAYGILGLTWLTPNEEAQKIARAELSEEIESALARGDHLTAESALSGLVASYEGRNIIGFTEEEAALARQRLKEVRKAIQEEDSGPAEAGPPPPETP